METIGIPQLSLQTLINQNHTHLKEPKKQKNNVFFKLAPCHIKDYSRS